MRLHEQEQKGPPAATGQSLTRGALGRSRASRVLPAIALGLAASSALAQSATFEIAALTPETAWQAAHAALQSCRAQGFQVAVAVVDRAGLTQVLLRDRFAGAHTVQVASDKAWTAASFRIATSALAIETQAGQALSGLRGLPRMLAVGGGLPIEGAGRPLGAIGVSGAPGAEADAVCAAAGVRAIADAIEF